MGLTNQSKSLTSILLSASLASCSLPTFETYQHYEFFAKTNSHSYSLQRGYFEAGSSAFGISMFRTTDRKNPLYDCAPKEKPDSIIAIIDHITFGSTQNYTLEIIGFSNGNGRIGKMMVSETVPLPSTIPDAAKKLKSSIEKNRNIIRYFLERHFRNALKSYESQCNPKT